MKRATRGRFPTQTIVSVMEYLEILYPGYIFQLALLMTSDGHLESRMLFMLPDEEEPRRIHCSGSGPSPEAAINDCLKTAVLGTDHPLALKEEEHERQRAGIV